VFQFQFQVKSADEHLKYRRQVGSVENNRRPCEIPVTRKHFLSSLALGALAGVPACLTGCVPISESPLRIGAIVWPGYECLFLARTLGLLDAQPIKLVEYPSSPEAIRAFRNGAIEVVAITGDEFLRLAADESGLRVILVTDFSNGADALVAQPEFDCVRKLEGKRVGVEVNATGVFMLTRSLDAVGMSVKDVEIVALENEQHVAAFETRRVDAVVSFEPNRTKLLKQGGRVLFDSSRIPGEVVDLLVTRESVLHARPDRLRALTKAWFAAREMMLHKTSEAAALVAPREGISPEEFAAALKLLTIPSLKENRRLLTRKEAELMQGFKKMHQVLRDAGRFKWATPNMNMLTGDALS
jgi:NitT/TauT family transport system substrate-binding protein